MSAPSWASHTFAAAAAESSTTAAATAAAAASSYNLSWQSFNPVQPTSSSDAFNNSATAASTRKRKDFSHGTLNDAVLRPSEVRALARAARLAGLAPREGSADASGIRGVEQGGESDALFEALVAALLPGRQARAMKALLLRSTWNVQAGVATLQIAPSNANIDSRPQRTRTLPPPPGLAPPLAPQAPPKKRPRKSLAKRSQLPTDDQGETTRSLSSDASRDAYLRSTNVHLSTPLSAATGSSASKATTKSTTKAGLKPDWRSRDKRVAAALAHRRVENDESSHDDLPLPSAPPLHPAHQPERNQARQSAPAVMPSTITATLGEKTTPHTAQTLFAILGAPVPSNLASATGLLPPKRKRGRPPLPETLTRRAQAAAARAAQRVRLRADGEHVSSSEAGSEADSTNAAAAGGGGSSESFASDLNLANLSPVQLAHLETLLAASSVARKAALAPVPQGYRRPAGRTPTLRFMLRRQAEVHAAYTSAQNSDLAVQAEAARAEAEHARRIAEQAERKARKMQRKMNALQSEASVAVRSWEVSKLRAVGTPLAALFPVLDWDVAMEEGQRPAKDGFKNRRDGTSSSENEAESEEDERERSAQNAKGKQRERHNDNKSSAVRRRKNASTDSEDQSVSPQAQVRPRPSTSSTSKRRTLGASPSASPSRSLSPSLEAAPAATSAAAAPPPRPRPRPRRSAAAAADAANKAYMAHVLQRQQKGRDKLRRSRAAPAPAPAESVSSVQKRTERREEQQQENGLASPLLPQERESASAERRQQQEALLEDASLQFQHQHQHKHQQEQGEEELSDEEEVGHAPKSGRVASSTRALPYHATDDDDEEDDEDDDEAAADRMARIIAEAEAAVAAEDEAERFDTQHSHQYELEDEDEEGEGEEEQDALYSGAASDTSMPLRSHSHSDSPCYWRARTETPHSGRGTPSPSPRSRRA